MQSQVPSSHENKYTKPESIPHALWRSFRGSLVLFSLAVIATAVICWFFDKRSFYDFGNALFYAGVVLAAIGGLIFNGNQQIVREQKNPFNPMNRVMLGSHSERTRRFWRDYMEGTSSLSVIGFAVVLCFGLGWLILRFIK